MNWMWEPLTGKTGIFQSILLEGAGLPSAGGSEAELRGSQEGERRRCLVGVGILMGQAGYPVLPEIPQS